MMTCMEINMFFSTVLQWAQALAKDEVLLFQSGFSQPLPAENAAGTGDGCTMVHQIQQVTKQIGKFTRKSLWHT